MIAAGEGGPTLIAIGGYRGREAVRARPRCSSAAGARARAATASRACRTRSPTCRTSRSSWSRADLPLRVARLRARARLGRRRGACAAGSPTSARTSCWPTRRVLTVRSDRRAHPPYGIEGGEAGSAVLEHDRRPRCCRRCRWKRSTLRKGDVFRARLGGRRRQRLAVRARPGARARGRARREGERRGGARALRRRRSRTARRLALMSFDVVDPRAAPSTTAPGAEAALADVGVDGRPHRGDRRARAERAQELDAAGLAVAPGFIDIHSHSDYTLLDRSARGRARSTRASRPRSSATAASAASRSAIRSRRAARSTATPDDLPISWSSAGEYFETARGAPARRQRAQPRPERTAAAGDARPRRPAGRRGRARGDAGAAARVARPGRLGLLDRARVRAGAGGERGRS